MHGFTLHYRHERCALLQRRLNSVTGLSHKYSDAKSHPPSAVREGLLFVGLRLLTTCFPVGAFCLYLPDRAGQGKNPHPASPCKRQYYAHPSLLILIAEISTMDMHILHSMRNNASRRSSLSCYLIMYQGSSGTRQKVRDTLLSTVPSKTRIPRRPTHPTPCVTLNVGPTRRTMGLSGPT